MRIDVHIAFIMPDSEKEHLGVLGITKENLQGIYKFSFQALIDKISEDFKANGGEVTLRVDVTDDTKEDTEE